MTKRSTVTLFALLALIAAFGLILTGCPDAAGGSSEIEYRDRDRPSVQVSEVDFTDGDSADPATIEFSVTLPEGAWDETALPGVTTGADLEEVFIIKVNESVQTATVDAWLTANSFTIERNAADPKKLDVTVFDDSGTTATYISKVSVGLNSVAALAGLIEDNPPLTLNTHAKEWKTDKALVTITDVGFVDGVASTSASAVTVTLQLSKGAWDTTITGANAKSLLSLTATVGGSLSALTPETPVVNGATLTLTLAGSPTTATNYTAIAAALVGTDMASSFTASGTSAIVDLDSAFTTSKVTLGSTTSQGTASYKSITGLTAQKSYIVLEGGVWYPVTTEGTLDTGLTELTAAAISSSGIANLDTNVVSITGLDNTKTYDVYMYTTNTSTLTLAGTKNQMVFLSADGYIIVAEGAIVGITVYVILDSAIVSNTNLATGTTPAADAALTTSGPEVWTFVANGTTSYAAGGAVVTYADSSHFFTLTSNGAGGAFKITRA